MNRCTEIIETEEFRYIALREDYYITTCLKYYGEYERAEFDLLLPLIDEDGVVLDIGSNIGTHTLSFARKAKRGYVHAFEPQRFIYQILSGNVALNGLTNVCVHHVGVGSEPDTIKLPVTDYSVLTNFGGFDMRQAAGNMPVEYETTAVITIDSLELKKLDLIKMDVESMEEDVLRGALKTISRFQPPIYLEAERVNFRGGLAPNTLRGFLRSIGYNMWLHRPSLVSAQAIDQRNPVGSATDPELAEKLKEIENCAAVNMFCVAKNSEQPTEDFLHRNHLIKIED